MFSTHSLAVWRQSENRLNASVQNRKKVNKKLHFYHAIKAPRDMS